MKVKSILLIGCLIMFTCTLQIKALELTKNYEIILATDAIPAEKTAAKEFQNYINRISGIMLTIQSTPRADYKQIFIGQSPAINALLSDVDFSRLKADEIIIRTVSDKLILSGGRRRGTLYAVYTFLEDNLGVRWWTSEDTFIPSIAKINIPQLNIHYAPVIENREIYYRDIIQNPEFAVHLKNNGHHMKIPDKLGGYNKIIGFVHTFDKILPAKKYLQKHPEWFSLVKGKRIGGQRIGQLCLSNNKMRQEFTKIVLKKLRKAKHPEIISISQNDNQNYCQCDECKKTDKEEGFPSGTLLNFVNKVAIEVEKEFPKVKVMTLAYQYTRKPPKNIVPAKNVIIRLCSIECDFSKPLNSDANQEFYNYFMEWGRIAPKLAVWNYVANFHNLIFPHPNIKNLANNVRFFANHKVFSLFEQGDSKSHYLAGDFAALRAWVLSKLAWNPKLDQDKLIKEFLTGYYGSAAPYLKQYLELMEKEIQVAGNKLSCYENGATWLSLDTANQAVKLFDQAEKTVKNNPKLSKRVKYTRVALDHLWVCYGRYLKNVAKQQKKPYNGPANLKIFTEQFIQNCKNLKIKQFTNSIKRYPFSKYVSELRQNQARYQNHPLPLGIKSLGNREWYAFQTDDIAFCELYNINKYCFKEKDQRASNQKTIRMTGNNNTEWNIQLRIPRLSKEKSWLIYLMLRCEASDLTGNALQAGIYNRKTKKTIFTKRIASKKINGKKYNLIKLGNFKLTSDMIVWVAPLKSHKVENIWVDRIILMDDSNAK